MGRLVQWGSFSPVRAFQVLSDDLCCQVWVKEIHDEPSIHMYVVPPVAASTALVCRCFCTGFENSLSIWNTMANSSKLMVTWLQATRTICFASPFPVLPGQLADHATVANRIREA